MAIGIVNGSDNRYTLYAGVILDACKIIESDRTKNTRATLAI